MNKRGRGKVKSSSLIKRESSPAESDSKGRFWTCTSEFRYGRLKYITAVDHR